MFNFDLKYQKQKVNYLYYSKCKYSKLNKVFNSPMGEKIVNKLELKIRDTEETREQATMKLLSYTANSWNFNPFANDEYAYMALRSCFRYSNLGKTKKLDVVNDSMTSKEGDDFDAMLFYRNANESGDILALEADFKYFLEGLAFVTKRFDKPSIKGLHMKILYNQLIGLANIGRLSFIKFDPNEDNSYAKSATRNKLVDLYHSIDGENGATRIERLTEEYLNIATPPKKIKGLTVDKFYLVVRDILNELCGGSIFKFPSVYSSKDVHDEIDMMTEKFNIEKFKENFLRSVPTIADWVKYSGKEFDYDYILSEIDIPPTENVKLKLSPSNGVIGSIPINVEEVLPTIIFKKNSESAGIAKYYDNIYLNLMDMLKKDEDKQYIYRNLLKLDEEMKFIFKTQAFSSINFNIEAETKARKLKESNDWEVDPVTKEIIDNKLLYSNAKIVTNAIRLISQYNINDNTFLFSVKDEVLANKTSTKMGLICGKFDKPLVIDDKSLDSDFVTSFVVTSDYVIISKDKIILPTSVKSTNGIPMLTVNGYNHIELR